MLIRHVVEEGVLHVALPHDPDVPSRAAAALQIETLLFTHRPRHVTSGSSCPRPTRHRHPSASSPAPDDLRRLRHAGLSRCVSVWLLG
ncbi:hypothetical protein STANM309S_00655 [Streptomyces tanashiensis]